MLKIKFYNKRLSPQSDEVLNSSRRVQDSRASPQVYETLLKKLMGSIQGWNLAI